MQQDWLAATGRDIKGRHEVGQWDEKREEEWEKLRKNWLSKKKTKQKKGNMFEKEPRVT